MNIIFLKKSLKNTLYVKHDFFLSFSIIFWSRKIHIFLYNMKLYYRDLQFKLKKQTERVIQNHLIEYDFKAYFKS